VFLFEALRVCIDLRSKKDIKESKMKQIVSSPELIALCGLYCGACKAYLSDKCPGCRENNKARDAAPSRSRVCSSYQSMECADGRLYLGIVHQKRDVDFRCALGDHFRLYPMFGDRAEDLA
jgi:phage FluMu protein Com